MAPYATLPYARASKAHRPTKLNLQNLLNLLNARGLRRGRGGRRGGRGPRGAARRRRAFDAEGGAHERLPVPRAAAPLYFRDPFLSAPLYFMDISRNCTRILSDARAVASASVNAPVFYGNFAKMQWRPTLRYPTLAPLRRIALLN